MPIIIAPQDASRLKRKIRPRTMAPPRPSTLSERQMRRALDGLWHKFLEPAKKRIEQMVRDGAPQPEINHYIQGALGTARDEYGINAGLIAEKWVSGLNLSTRQAFEEGLAATLGVDVKAVLDTLDISDAVSEGADEAANLIVTIPEDYLGKVSDAVVKNFRGEPLPEDRSLLSEVQVIGDISYKRSKLIARDQTNKLTSTFNRVRQQSIGVDEYFWMTVRDQRVVGNPNGRYPEARGAHGNHYKMHGKLCKWSDPSVYSDDNGKTWRQREGDMPQNNVGEDIQCRCFPRPKIDIQKILQHVED